MPGPLKNDDEAIPRPHVGGPDEKIVPGEPGDVESTTEANHDLGEAPGDGDILPSPLEQEQDIATGNDTGGGGISPTESPEDKADEIINGGIALM